MSVETDLRIRHLSPAFRTFCGEGALDALPRELARTGARRAVIICIPAVAARPGDGGAARPLRPEGPGSGSRP